MDKQTQTAIILRMAEHDYLMGVGRVFLSEVNKEFGSKLSMDDLRNLVLEHSDFDAKIMSDDILHVYFDRSLRFGMNERIEKKDNIT